MAVSGKKQQAAYLEALEKAKLRVNVNVNFDLVIELLLLVIKEN